MLLSHRVLAKDIDENPENNPRRVKSKHSFGSPGPIDELYRIKRRQEEQKKAKYKLDLPLHEIMKIKLKERRREREQCFMEPLPTLEKTYDSDVFSSPQKELSPLEGCRRKWSVADEPEVSDYTPNDQELKYLVIALGEFEKARFEPNPNGRVE